MDALTLQDRLNRAGGRSAAVIGTPHDLLRPTTTLEPLGPASRILRLNAAFIPVGGRYTRPVLFGEALWEGVFDAAYTRPGDILRGIDTGTIHFVAAKQKLLPVLCVRAPRRVDITRPAAASAAGLNSYGGTVTATDTTLATAWPASILGVGGQGTGQSGIAADLSAGAWQVLLPISLNVTLRIGDRLTDDLGRIAVIATAELTELGWRLSARQANT
jgi:hypothetical protein